MVTSGKLKGLLIIGINDLNDVNNLGKYKNIVGGGDGEPTWSTWTPTLAQVSSGCPAFRALASVFIHV